MRNGVTATGAEILGEDWPDERSTWPGDDPAQVASTDAAALALGIDAPAGGVCIASDHAAVVATLTFGQPRERAPRRTHHRQAHHRRVTPPKSLR